MIRSEQSTLTNQHPASNEAVNKHISSALSGGCAACMSFCSFTHSDRGGA